MQPTGPDRKFTSYTPDSISRSITQHGKIRAKTAHVGEALKDCHNCHAHSAPEWRHVKDETGKVILRDEAGHDLWLCNRCGLKQDRAIREAKAVKRKMSIENILNDNDK